MAWVKGETCVNRKKMGALAYKISTFLTWHYLLNGDGGFFLPTWFIDV